MSAVARYGRLVAREGEGERVGELLVAAAEELRGEPGCELYLVSRESARPEVVWVTELWRSREDLDAVRERLEGSERVAAVMELVAEEETVELDLLGGKGAGPTPSGDAGPPTSLVKLNEVEDLAASAGHSELQEARFPNQALGTESTGLAHLRLKPNARQPFAHRHGRAEEVYVVLSGSGKAKLNEEITAVEAGDAIRISPAVIRAFEAGPEGLELLAFGPKHPGDGEIFPDWWTD